MAVLGLFSGIVVEVSGANVSLVLDSLLADTDRANGLGFRLSAHFLTHAVFMCLLSIYVGHCSVTQHYSLSAKELIFKCGLKRNLKLDV